MPLESQVSPGERLTKKYLTFYKIFNFPVCKHLDFSKFYYKVLQKIFRENKVESSGFLNMKKLVLKGES